MCIYRKLQEVSANSGLYGYLYTCLDIQKQSDYTCAYWTAKGKNKTYVLKDTFWHFNIYANNFNCWSLKRLYHRRVFIQVCLQIDPESYEWGLLARSVDLKWNPQRRMIIAELIDYATLCQACRYLRDKHYPNRSVRDALRICYFNITISWKR